jgi:HPr Serine kinase C-terminal domain
LQGLGERFEFRGVARLSHHYRLGPAKIDSEIVLPGLLASSGGEHDGAITVRRGPPVDPDSEWLPLSDRWDPLPQGGLRTLQWQSANGSWYRLHHSYGCHFVETLISGDGSQVRVHTSNDILDADLASLLEGVILGSAMRLRGQALLHACVLARDGSAIALMGDSGVGKSSLTWALVQRGCRLLSDDLAALARSNDVLYAHPARTRLRLQRETAERLTVGGAHVTGLYPAVDGLNRVVIADSDAVERAAVCLYAIYMLGPRETGLSEPRIEEMRPAEKLAALAANVYGSIDPGREARRKELAALAHFAAGVPIRRLTLPDAIDALPDVAEHLRLRIFG